MTTFKLLAGMALICTLSIFTACSENDLEPVVENDIETILSNANKVGTAALRQIKDRISENKVVRLEEECMVLHKAKGFGTLGLNCGYAPNVRVSVTIRNTSSGSGLIHQGSDRIWFKITSAFGGGFDGIKIASFEGYVTRINNERFSAYEIPMRGEVVEFDGEQGMGYNFGTQEDCNECPAFTEHSGSCGAIFSSGRLNISLIAGDCDDSIDID